MAVEQESWSTEESLLTNESLSAQHLGFVLVTKILQVMRSACFSFSPEISVCLLFVCS